MADLTLNELAAKCAEQAQEIERCRKAVQPHPEQMGGAGWKLDASIPTADKVEAYAEIMDDELKATSELLAGANEDLLALRAQLAEQAQEIKRMERERNLERQRESDGRARQDAKWIETVSALRAQLDRAWAAVREMRHYITYKDVKQRHAQAIEEAKEAEDGTRLAE